MGHIDTAIRKDYYEAMVEAATQAQPKTRVKTPVACPLCQKRVKGNVGLGLHQRNAHGIIGVFNSKAKDKLAKEQAEQAKPPASAEAQTKTAPPPVFSEQKPKAKVVRQETATVSPELSIILGGKMGKIVESTNCPTCGTRHISGVMQKYEVPEIPMVDKGAVEAVKSSLDALTAKIAASPMPEVNLQPITDTLGDISARISQIEEYQGHIKPTPALFSSFESCPDCAPEWQKVKSVIQADCPGCKEKDKRIAELTKVAIPETAKETAKSWWDR